MNNQVLRVVGQTLNFSSVNVCANRYHYDSGKLVTHRADSFTKYLIPGMGIGYDVMAYVGLQRFLYHRQREEIGLSLLHDHGISISAGMINNLAKLFLGYEGTPQWSC